MTHKLLSAILAAILLLTGLPAAAADSGAADSPPLGCGNSCDIRSVVCRACEYRCGVGSDGQHLGSYGCGYFSCHDCYVYHPGDVDGDGIISHHDVFEVILRLWRAPSIIDHDINARIAATFSFAPGVQENLVREEPNLGDRNPWLNHMLQIARAVVGMSHRVPGLPQHDDIPSPTDVEIVRLLHVTSGFRAAICASRRRVIYTTARDFDTYEHMIFAFTSPQSVSSFVAAIADGESRIQGDLDDDYTARIVFSGRESQEFFAAHHRPLPEGSIIAWQVIGVGTPPPVPADFTPDPLHNDGDIVWEICRCSECWQTLPDCRGVLRERECDCGLDCVERFGRFRFGDVDGDGMLTPNDFAQILNRLAGSPSVIDRCADARRAANIVTQRGESPNTQDALAIMRRLSGGSGSNRFDWRDDEISRVFLGEPMTLSGVICRRAERVLYYNDLPMSADLVFYFNFLTSGKADFYSPYDDLSFGGGFEERAWTFRSRAVSAGTLLFVQRITDRSLTPEDFVLDPHHEDGAIVWRFCTDVCCGGAFGFGNVTGGSEPAVRDALAILRYVVGLDSPIAACDKARAAANITTPGLGRPSAIDALQILRQVVGLPSRLGWYES
jgi:hypothetical protein